jgi:hypothetical protein
MSKRGGKKKRYYLGVNTLLKIPRLCRDNARFEPMTYSYWDRKKERKNK